jgi:glycosyltransferase involved in cell wall biosynthesis
MAGTSVAGRLRLLIIGDGPQRQDLESLVARLGIGAQVRFVGAVAHEDVPSWLNKLDIYVAASRLDSESFGVAVIEASACALPVVVSDAGGLPEVVIDGVTGLIVPRDSPGILAQRLADLLINDEQRGFLGRNGRKHVVDKYGWDACVNTMIDCYKRLVTTRNAACRRAIDEA